MMDVYGKNIYDKVIEHYGKTAQKEKAIEELEELKAEIWDELQHSEYDMRKMVSEISDVYNMLQQLRRIYGITWDEVDVEMRRKMQRTLERIKEEQRQSINTPDSHED